MGARPRAPRPIASPAPTRPARGPSTCPATRSATTSTCPIKSPGGAADFASTRAFLVGLQASSSPGLSGAPATTSAEPGATDLEISLKSLPGVGDDAFIGAAGTIYAIKGDTELELQLISADDPTAQQDTIDLLKKALARLP